MGRYFLEIEGRTWDKEGGGKRESPRLGSNIYTEILPKLINWTISQSQSDPFVSLAKGSKYCTSSLSGCAILHPIRE